MLDNRVVVMWFNHRPQEHPIDHGQRPSLHMAQHAVNACVTAQNVSFTSPCGPQVSQFSSVPATRTSRLSPLGPTISPQEKTAIA